MIVSRLAHLSDPCGDTTLRSKTRVPPDGAVGAVMR
jgi:hypothetical protein